MTIARRSFIRALGLGGAGVITAPSWINARGLEAATAEELTGHTYSPPSPDRFGAASDLIKLDSNENPYGPAPDAINAIMRDFNRAALYPARNEPPVREAIANANGIAANHIMLGCGSTEILRVAVQAFCSPTKHLVTASPSFETPASYARTLGLPVREIPLDADLRIDLQGMLRESRGAGLVFLCNPNNPTGHVYGESEVTSFIEEVIAADPSVMILVDEAYHEFVTTPSYATALPLVAKYPQVFVSRTFSKIYGIAGLRAGYAFGQPATLRRMSELRIINGFGGFAQLAAIGALGNPAHLKLETERNKETLAFTTRWFRERGYKVIDSDANFVFVNTGMPAAQFRERCAARNVAVGRPFPPITDFSRISIGTMDEMQRATAIFAEVLS